MATMPYAVVMTKTGFAEHIGVSPGRVSQMIRDELIDSAALAGQGPHAKVIVNVAKRQIADRRHVGQALGNGIATRLAIDLPEPPATYKADIEGFVVAFMGLLQLTLTTTYGIPEDEASALVAASFDKARGLAFQWDRQGQN